MGKTYLFSETPLLSVLTKEVKIKINKGRVIYHIMIALNLL